MVVLAVFCLTVGHPGFGFKRTGENPITGVHEGPIKEVVPTEKAPEV